jgi:hypothetical protein
MPSRRGSATRPSPKGSARIDPVPSSSCSEPTPPRTAAIPRPAPAVGGRREMCQESKSRRRAGFWSSTSRTHRRSTCAVICSPFGPPPRPPCPKGGAAVSPSLIRRRTPVCRRG